MKIFGSIFIFILLSCSFLHGQELTTDRPGQGESATLVPKNLFQIEYGMSLSNSYSISDLCLLSNLYRYGFSEKIELRLAHSITLGNITSFGGNGKNWTFSDIEAGCKYSLVNSDVQSAIIAHLVFPSGSEEVSNKKLGIVSKMTFSHNVTDESSMGYTACYENPGEGKGDLSAAASLGILFSESFCVFTELYCAFPEFSDAEWGNDNGFTYLIKENLQIDFSFGFSLNRQNNFYAAGICWRLPK